MSLTQLPASTIKLITSSQIITSVSSAVKELFENALDAGATSVDVKLVNYGMDRIEVKDNGSGISKENTLCMALPHYTSKISNFNDLEALETYGFRGEALNALCKVGQVTLTTATASDSMAMVYTLDSSGNISGSKPSHHVQGTTVVVLNLFKNLPVRRQLMGSSRRAQEELKQVETVVKSLAVIKANIRVTLSHNKCQIWQKTPCSNLQNSFAQLVGYSTCQQLEFLSHKISEEVCVDMLIPKRDCDINAMAKSTPTLSLIFVNGRPVTYKRILKVLHQQLAGKFGDNFASRKFAVCLFSVNIAASSVDVNLEPNKTKVLVKDEDIVLSALQGRLQEYYCVPIPHAENTLVEPLSNQVAWNHTPPLGSDENSPRKKRKIDDTQSNIECEISDVNNDVNSKALSEPNTSENNECVERKVVSCCQVIQSDTETPPEKLFIVENTSQACQSKDVEKMYQIPDLEASNKTYMNIPCEIQESKIIQNDPDVVSENHFEAQLWEVERDVGINFSTLSNNQVPEHKTDFPEVQVHKASNLSESENLWEDVHTNDLNALTMCLDALVGAPEKSPPAMNGDCSDVVKGVDLVGTEAWSMGLVGLPKGEIVKGSCVLIGGQTVSSDQRQEATTSVEQKQTSPTEFPAVIISEDDAPSITKQTEPTVFVDKNPNRSPHKGPVSAPPQKSPKKSPRAVGGNDVSPGLDSSLQSVSSQMGRRELAAFTKFAREVRPQIILENPGIAFTLVASVLAKKWQALSDDEREHYEEMARETATAKKVWKSYDKQKKLEWVKKLPEQIKTTKPSCRDRPPRKEVLNSVNMENVKEKFSIASLKLEREHQFSNSSSICLLGQLEPSGTWVCLEKSVISLLNHSRLQEVVINHRLLNTHALLLKPSSSRDEVNQDVLGEEAWKTLLSLPCKFDELRQTKIVSADIIMKNGFKIELRGDNRSAVLIEVAEALNYFGVKELKEVLILAKTWPVVQLSECRPLRVVNHIKSEAMRICRKSPSVLDRTMVGELLEYWRTVMLPKDVNCLHSKPIMTPVYNIFEKTNLYNLC